MKNHEQSNAEKEWENLLDPRALKSRLIFFSLYIASYEHLKSCIVDRIKDFFTHGFDESGWKVDSKYQAELRGTGKKHLTEQSVAWLQKMNAIDACDVDFFNEIKKHRNKIVHELPSLVAKSESIDIELFKNILTLLKKIEVWWIRNVEMATDPDHDGEEISDADILPGTFLFLQLLQEVALGEGEEAERYLKEFQRLKR